jgi:hypothetical protein
MLTLVVLVNGEIWTDESVFWQNKLVDGASYKVVYSYAPPPPRSLQNILLTHVERPWFFQVNRILSDIKHKVPWATQYPYAAKVPADAPPKMKIVLGPSRRWNELRLSQEHGTLWPDADPRNGRSLGDIRRRDVPPPPYSESVSDICTEGRREWRLSQSTVKPVSPSK